MPKAARPKMVLKAKDLAPKGDAAKHVKGGVTGPCNRSRK